jgi:hypothetical protein
MAPGDCDDTTRQELIRLLEGEEESWRITYSALNKGRQILPHFKGHFGAYAINLFILDRLRSGFPMHAVKLGSGGVGCVMNNADGQGLYIKVTIENDIAVILSFHRSKHQKDS